MSLTTFDGCSAVSFAADQLLSSLAAPLRVIFTRVTVIISTALTGGAKQRNLLRGYNTLTGQGAFGSDSRSVVSTSAHEEEPT